MDGGIEKAKNNIIAADLRRAMVPDIDFTRLPATLISDDELISKLSDTVAQIPTHEAGKRWERSMTEIGELGKLPSSVRKALRLDVDVPQLIPDYSSQFPLPKESTLQQLLAQQMGGGVSESEFNKAVARGITPGLLENYSGQGGILIGRSAQSAQADVVGLDWTLQSNDLTLSLSLRDGRHIVLGPYPSSLAYQALAYASDPRMSAATVVRTPFDGIDKVLLHPALEDTTFGCRVIMADHWIFDAITPGAQQTVDVIAMRRAEMQVAAYNAVVKTDWPDHTTKFPPEFLDALRDVSASPLTMDREFNQSIVQALQKCAEKGDATISCAKSGMTSQNAQPVKAPHFVSHLREKQYAADSDLKFTRVNKEANDTLELSVLFPINDEESWYLHRGDQAFVNSVLSYITTQGQDSNLYELRTFIALERLFRSAFDGTLGSGFPTQRLISLARNLTPHAPPEFATPRWKIYRPNASVERQFAADLTSLAQLSSKGDLLNPIPHSTINALDPKRQMMRCIRLINSTGRPDLIPSNEWSANCSFSSLSDESLENKNDGSVFKLSQLAYGVARMRNLRSELLSEGGTELQCPPPPAAFARTTH